MWPSLIKKAREGGLDAIETYIFWNAHEPQKRQYDFSGNLDFIRFFKTVQAEGLYAILRIGPYVCAEWTYGGFPMWLHNMENIQLRTNNSVYQNEMKIFTTKIIDMAKKEKLFAPQGGPIIVTQIENEYGNIMSSYGNAGKEYIQWCATMALAQNVGVPWIMCQQSDAPKPMINTCNGYYCDQFTPNDANSPKSWTENWVGWFKMWGGPDPHRTAEDVSYGVAKFFQFGGTFQNYYMYHGGTNFGRTAGGPMITTTYDYDAPLDEYGNLNQPKWGHLKQLHLLLKSMEKVLTYGEIKNIDYNSSVKATMFTLDGKSSCFIGSANETSDVAVKFQGIDINIPAWSVSIFPDCHTEAYNTAKVNTPSHVMVKKENEAEDAAGSLDWSWMSEPVEDAKPKNHKGAIIATKLLDQKVAGKDASDHLWYMTSVHVTKKDLIWGEGETYLRVNTSGHVLHAFVNGKSIGSQWGENGVYNFVFTRKVALKLGLNTIALLSTTVGFANYGGNFDLKEVGVTGPVELTRELENHVTVSMDLSFNKWVHKVGLYGEEQKLYEPVSLHHKFDDEDVPTNRMLVWYKAAFNPPSGEEPVVVDLLGLGKGHAWVNGHSIGRYWPSFTAHQDGCSATCDYRGAYGEKKCLTGCGESSQRFYHVPRSFLNKEGQNTLVLFEELGGDPSKVNFKTVTVGKVCGNAYEGNTMQLECSGGKPISEIKFASFGDPTGSCGSFSKGTFEAPNTLSFIRNACVGKASCSFNISGSTFGAMGCPATPQRLAVEALC